MKNKSSAPLRLRVSALKGNLLAGLILAGGEGSRWGGPKAWAGLPDGRSFLEACAGTLRDAGAVRLVATLPPGSQPPPIERLEALPLPEHDLDMFASVRIGLRFLIQSEDWARVIVWPVDHPLVRVATVEALAGSDAPALIPSFGGKRGHPICLDRQIVASIVVGDLAGPTMRDVLREAGAEDVAVEDPGVIANCNTPEALSEVLKASNSEF